MNRLGSVMHTVLDAPRTFRTFLVRFVKTLRRIVIFPGALKHTNSNRCVRKF